MSIKHQTGIPGSKESYKIAVDEVEFTEKQFMDDEFQYYKTIKTKPRKKTHSEQIKRPDRQDN